ncbi:MULTISPECIES: lytic transglycosylase domain-containing protein [unclassified Bacillus (in: firmicutes)]|uniref:lytic transglycosylase domain-containing protein n=1 Tax=unclassified Bacillus (in: firmicutes) TaxID=185979 RepID=UPI001BEC330D|nr:MULTISPECIES: lytic transglycosylase domain-containing protein [unclassified Bacillus (in: firmicutes)]MBT2639233.1 lytic transglycosylase domain-containing protein [Bacillus sp. ISL-39]MBT2659837.1 lytic transglycosylase domain-containing protein [Bacillus sp. ISL-45]
MNVDQLKVILELQALQNFNKPTSQSGNGLFQEMLSGILSEESNALGATATRLEELFNSAQTAVNNLDLAKQSVSHMLPPVQLTKVAAKSNANFDGIIDKAASMFNIPAKLIKSVIQKESNFNPNAVSHAGASGLMQLMPATASGLGVKNVFDPAENIIAGSKYLRQMLDRYDNNLELALAAYNAGPGNVDKYGGIPPFKETQNYVRKVTDVFYT